MKNYSNHLDKLNRLMNQMGKEIPHQMQGYTDLHKASISDGALARTP